MILKDFNSISLSKKLIFINLIFLGLGWYLHDPFSLFVNDYRSAQAFLSREQSIDSIQIQLLSSEQNVLYEEILEINPQSKKDWNLKVNDFVFDSDLLKVSTLLDTIYELRNYTEIGSNKDGFGFQDETIHLNLSYQENDVLNFSISQEIPSGGGSYILVNSKVYLVPFQIRDLISVSDPYSFALKSIANLDFFQNVNSIIIKKEKYILDQQPEIYNYNLDQGIWTLNNLRISQENLSQLEQTIQSLQVWKADEFYTKQAVDWKLIPKISIQIANDKKQIKPIQLDCKFINAKSNYLCLKNNSFWMEIDRYSVEAFLKIFESKS
ncbi:MAG: DUF4340 domain-containing protein [Leptospiraceae bacterium]|nr:DUF4340 domain-containing protein [Leptospiraceae bacterium]